MASTSRSSSTEVICASMRLATRGITASFGGAPSARADADAATKSPQHTIDAMMRPPIPCLALLDGIRRVYAEVGAEQSGRARGGRGQFFSGVPTLRSNRPNHPTPGVSMRLTLCASLAILLLGNQVASAADLRPAQPVFDAATLNTLRAQAVADTNARLDALSDAALEQAARAFFAARDGGEAAQPLEIDHLK